MNYRHSFHAGNVADVLKHVVLTALVDYLARKPAGFCVLDIHAGRGRYDLAAVDAQRTREFSDGIARVWAHAADAPPLTRRYLDLVRDFNRAPCGSATLAQYPGSPCLVRQQLRAQDRLIACELQPAEHALLDAEFRGDRAVAVHARDGWEALGALLPPREKRGAVLIDPPYEPPLDEVERVMEGLRETQRRFPTGVVAVWFPIKEGAASLRLLRRFRALGLGDALVAELCVWPDDTAVRLNGSGMLVVNPPWQFDRALAGELGWLWDKLSHERHGHHGVQSLTARCT